MAYTPNNNPYIAGDPYSYDLKWLVRKIREHDSALAAIPDQIQAAVIAALDQHDPVYYRNAAELIASAQNAGSIAYIEGFYNEGDGGANLYYITDDYNDIIGVPFYITLTGANRWGLPIILTPYITPEMFGAKGDGTTDDSAALRIALENYDNIELSKAYYIGGTFAFSDLANKTVHGGALVFCDFSFNNCNEINIKGVDFTQSNKAITLTECSDIYISECYFESNAAYASPRFVEVYGGYNIAVEKCHIINTQYAVVSRPYTAPVFKLTVQNCFIENTVLYTYPAAINIAEGYQVLVTGNTIKGIKDAGSYGYGVYTGDQMYNDPENLIIDSNYIHDCDRAVRLHLIKNVKIINNTITSCNSVSIETLGDASTGTAETVTENIIISNNSADNFIAINKNTHNVIISGNYLKRLSSAAFNYGIYVNGDASNKPAFVHISDNIIDSPQRSGVYIAFGSNVKIEGNTIINANTETTGPVYAQGGIAVYIGDNTSIINNKIESALAAILINANAIKTLYAGNETNGGTAAISGGYNAQPSSGVWNVGETGYYQNPASAGYIGFVCTVSGDFGGTPPTFQNFGALV